MMFFHSRIKFNVITKIVRHKQNELKFLNNTKVYVCGNSRSMASATSDGSVGAPKEKYDDYSAMTSEGPKKLPPRLPLVKNFFVGLVDKELLSFPEVIRRDDMHELDNALKPIKDYFNGDEFVVSKSLPEDLKSLGLYGLNAPLEYGGKDWNISGSLMATEPECLSSYQVAIGLLSHRSLIDTIKEKGSNIQHQKLLPALTKGSLVATNAIFEQDLVEYGILNTKATYDFGNRVWNLNGSKTGVIMPPKTADAHQLFVVLAQSDRFNNEQRFTPTTSVFLVDATTPGVTIGEEKIETLGAGIVDMREVHFRNVELDDTCILGNAHEGNKILECFLNYQRLRQAMIATCMCKNVVNYLTRYCINNKHFAVSLTDLESVRTHLAKACISIYGMESIIYLTAGLLDEFDRPDITIEAAIAKYYSVRRLLKIMQSFFDILGQKCILNDERSEMFIREAMHLYAQDETMDSLSVFIALCGLKHAGTLIGDDIRRQRNPLYNPLHVFKKFIEKNDTDDPSTNMALNEKLHPTLGPVSLFLEQSVARLHMSVEVLLTRYGINILTHHNEVQRLTEMTAIIYTMFASLAHASRSYCIGLPLSDHELLAASTICVDGQAEVKFLTNEIHHGQHLNNDTNWQRLSKQIIKSKGYFAVNPLTYNF